MSRCLWFLIVLLAGGFATAAEAAKPLLIAAASDLKFALGDVLTAFEKDHPAHAPRAAYGSSGTLFAQIENGAPFDLFLSADARLPRQLVEHGKAEAFFSYAMGHLVVWVPNGSKLDPAKSGLRALADPAVRKVAIANPAVAPYGAAAQAALQKVGVHEAIESRLVLGENVAQAAQFVLSGGAEAGLISLSLALSPKMREAGRSWPVPEGDYPPLEQGGVLCTSGRNREGAVQLRDLLCSPAGRAILDRHGFTPPAGLK